VNVRLSGSLLTGSLLLVDIEVESLCRK
jgi:hypothetical protein